MKIINKYNNTINIKEGELAMLRVETKYGYSDTWWRIMFIDNDGTFIGKLERHHWYEYDDYKKGDDVRLDCDEIQKIYQEGEQFCYGDNITICECEALCRNK